MSVTNDAPKKTHNIKLDPTKSAYQEVFYIDYDP